MQIFNAILSSFIAVTVTRLLFRKVLDLPAYRGKLLTDIYPAENLMEEDKFWQIIKMTSRNSNKNYEKQCVLLTEYLGTLNAAEIIQFDRTLALLIVKSYSFKLWEPAYALNGGLSDDGFEYFRSWLIAQGKNKFYWTKKYPRLLFLVGVKEFIENYEGLGYCPYDAYLKTTGDDLPNSEDITFADGGQMFKEGEAFLRYPELALLAW